MIETRTPEQIAEQLAKAVEHCNAKGWSHVIGWIFRAPKGTCHDLSASSLEWLDYIEANGTNLVEA